MTNRPGRGRPRKRARPQRANSDSDENSEEDEGRAEGRVRKAGHKYVLLEAPWFSKAAPRIFEAKKTEPYNELQRFNTVKSKVQGELRAFRKGMDRQRSNTSSRLRNYIGTVFAHHIPGRVASGDDIADATIRAGYFDLIGGRTVEKEVNGAVVRKREYNAFDARVLHSDMAEKFNVETFLRSELLIHVTAALVYGPQKARSLATNTGSGSTTSCMADIHGVTHTTPGMVANAAILTCWTLSADVELQRRGKQTAIDWLKMHEDIHAYLIDGIHQKRSPVITLFRAWDDELFPDTETSLGTSADSDGASANQSGLQQALEVLRGTSVVTEGAATQEGDGPSGNSDEMDPGANND
ncbi:hypothetical protein K438DRAFT_1601054 [Mycena galopus ATCC 62051]|nr:hypothetical protein K438DRAFT_1601054 [Mycena galopus ATCC 62051]